MILHEYYHVTPLGSRYNTSIELEEGANGKQFIRITQDNEFRGDEPDEILIEVDKWKELTELITKVI